MSEFQQSLHHASSSREGPAIQSGMMRRLAMARQAVRHHVRRNRTLLLAIQLVTISVYALALFASSHQAEYIEQHGYLAKRQVLNGRECEHRRSQLGVFMAAFFGGMFAADQWFARNFQLAIPKFIYMFCGGLIGSEIVILGFSVGFAWWLCDVVMWGFGFYTTHTHWSNPTKGCAVRGW